jgi:hypothetical protein
MLTLETIHMLGVDEHKNCIHEKIGALGCLGIGLGGLILMAIIIYVVFGGFYNKAISLNE